MGLGFNINKCQTWVVTRFSRTHSTNVYLWKSAVHTQPCPHEPTFTLFLTGRVPHFKAMRSKWSFSSPGWSGITRTSCRIRLDPSPFIWCFFVFLLLFDPAVKHPSTLCLLLNVTGLHYSDLLTYDTDLLVWQRPSIIRDCHGLPNPLRVYTPRH